MGHWTLQPISLHKSEKSTMKNYLQKPYIFFLIVALGVVAAMVLVKARAPLEHAGTEMPSKNVATIFLQKIAFRAMVTAYGNVEPTVTLKIIAEVRGKISYLHPDLKRGNSIAAGTVVVRIDSEDYKVSLKQTQADLTANRSSLKQLQVEQQSTRDSLDLANKNLQVGEVELERIRSVWEKKLIARATLDAQEQKT